MVSCCPGGHDGRVVAVADLPVSFGSLLRTLRSDAGRTQEELAGASGLSARSVSDLERGVNQTARKDTARLLADALGLAGSDRAAFESVARGHAVAGSGPRPRRRALPGDLVARYRSLALRTYDTVDLAD